jgi:DNA end-binding protein Ku
MGMLLRYPYEVRNEDEYFDDIQDVKVTRDMLDLAKHIVEQKSATFEPAKFEDRYESALTTLINQKRSGRATGAKPRPSGENVVDLMEALKRSVSGAPKSGSQPKSATQAKRKKPRKAIPGQKEMLLPIAGKGGAAKEQAKEQTKKPAKATTRRKAG